MEGRERHPRENGCVECGTNPLADFNGPEDPDRAGKLLLTVAECAEMLGVSRNKMFQLLARKELPSVKIERCRRVPVAALAEFVANLTEATVKVRRS